MEAFYLFCATVGAGVPEIQTLAETVSTWRAEICRGVATGYSNSAAEGVNRLVKLVYRAGFAFTNVTNQQRRSRYVASRGTRPVWLSAEWQRQALQRRETDAMPAPVALPLPKTRAGHVDPLVEANDQQLHTVTTDWTQSVAA